LKRTVAICSLLLAAGCSSEDPFKLPVLNAAGSSGPFRWEAMPNPVIPRGNRADVLNPSVVNFHGMYWNFYSEYDGQAWHTAAATSPDGITWTEQGRVLSPQVNEGGYIAANGSALVVGEEVWCWYEIGYPIRLALAKSRDGLAWSRVPDFAIAEGPTGSFDEFALADPYVIRAGDFFYLYYLGQNKASQQLLGVARSRDGIKWEKYAYNPILYGVPGAFDENLGEPAVWSSGGKWWMLYTGRAHDERRRLGLAQSRDGVGWERVPNFVIEGDQAWNKTVIADPTVEPMPDGSIRVWFGAGDAPSPDQNLHGQIGMGYLR
jgi:sucrose-6-phosphate hydrolase SacC (GH32 family)